MAVVLPLALWLGLGAIPAAAFARRRRWGLAVAVVPFAGALAITCPWILSAGTGWPASTWLVLPAAVVLWAGLELLLGRTRQIANAPTSCPAGSRRVVTAIALGLVLIVAGTCVWSGFVLGQGFPGYGWDGYMIWILRAKVLADSDAFPRELVNEPMLSASHWDYPLLLPGILAWFRRIGGLDVKQLSIVVGLLAGIIPLVGWAGLRRRLGPGCAAAAVLCPFVVHGTVRYHFAGYADPLMVLAVTPALAFGLAGAVDRDRAALVTGGVALAAGVSTKNEGMLWLVAGCAGIGLLSLETRSGFRSALTGALRWAAAAGVFFAAWRLACSSMGIENDILSRFALADVPSRSLLVAGGMARRAFAKGAFLALGSAALAWMLVSAQGGLWPRIRRTLILLACPAAYLAGVFVVYLGTHLQLKWHLATSAERVLYGVGPALLVTAMFASARRRGEAASSA